MDYIEVQRSSNADEFLQRSEPWLLGSEAENNVMLGIARRFKGECSGADSENYWATVTRAGQVVGTAFRTPPYPLALSNLPLEALPLLVGDVAERFSKLPGVNGPIAVAEQFAGLWVERFGGSWHVKLRQRIHMLTALNELTRTIVGGLRRMETDDAPLVTQWMDEFSREIGTTGAVDRITQHLEQRNFYLWEDNGPRSIAGVLRDSPHGACISAVYTPLSYRRQGYATATVAALSEKLLASGKDFCCLYTDLANPTSNSIYRQVGYRPIRDDVALVIEAD